MIAINTSPSPRSKAALAPAPVSVLIVGSGVAPVKTAAYGVDSLLREMGQYVALLRASSLVSQILCSSIPIFCFNAPICVSASIKL